MQFGEKQPATSDSEVLRKEAASVLSKFEKISREYRRFPDTKTRAAGKAVFNASYMFSESYSSFDDDAKVPSTKEFYAEVKRLRKDVDRLLTKLTALHNPDFDLEKNALEQLQKVLSKELGKQSVARLRVLITAAMLGSIALAAVWAERQQNKDENKPASPVPALTTEEADSLSATQIPEATSIPEIPEIPVIPTIEKTATELPPPPTETPMPTPAELPLKLVLPELHLPAFEDIVSPDQAALTQENRGANAGPHLNESVGAAYISESVNFSNIVIANPESMTETKLPTLIESRGKYTDNTKEVSYSAAEILPLCRNPLPGYSIVRGVGGDHRGVDIVPGNDDEIEGSGDTIMNICPDAKLIYRGWDDLKKQDMGLGFMAVTYHEVVIKGQTYGVYIMYGHLVENDNEKFTPSEEQQNQEVDVIGKVGNTGHSSGPHLHSELAITTDPIVPGSNPAENVELLKDGGFNLLPSKVTYLDPTELYRETLPKEIDAKTQILPNGDTLYMYTIDYIHTTIKIVDKETNQEQIATVMGMPDNIAIQYTNEGTEASLLITNAETKATIDTIVLV